MDTNATVLINSPSDLDALLGDLFERAIIIPEALTNIDVNVIHDLVNAIIAEAPDLVVANDLLSGFDKLQEVWV